MDLPKEVEVFYPENYNILLKKIKEDLNKWRDILCSWVGRLYIKMPILTKIIDKFNATSIKLQ